MRTLTLPRTGLWSRAGVLGVVIGVGLALGGCGQKASESAASAPERAASPDASLAAETEETSSPAEDGPRSWVVRGDGVNLRKEPSLSAAVLTTFSNGTLLDHLGCRRVAGRDWCDVQPLGGGPRGFVAAELLKPAVARDGAVARGDDTSALRAGEGDFDATGTMPCAMAQGQPMGRCPFGVARAGGGDATVVVTRPDGRKRALFFRMGQAIGADTSQADGNPAFSTSKEGDTYTIRVGNERYEFPEAVVFGG
ncbi:MAG: SH3 domain-containing protein [Cyanobacteria bacterium J06638_7]